MFLVSVQWEVRSRKQNVYLQLEEGGKANTREEMRGKIIVVTLKRLRSPPPLRAIQWHQTNPIAQEGVKEGPDKRLARVGHWERHEGGDLAIFGHIPVLCLSLECFQPRCYQFVNLLCIF